MNVHAKVLRLSLLSGGLFAALSAAPASAADLTIQVLERGSGAPLQGAAVCLGTGADAAQMGAYRSDANGKVRFEDIIDAPLVLTVSKSGYRGERRDLSGMHYDREMTVLLPRGGLGPNCNAPSAGGADRVVSVSDFRIDSGAAATRQRRVRLQFSTDGQPTDFRVSEARDFGQAQWQPLSSQATYELSSGPGPKRVYLQVRKYRESEGVSLESRSEVVSDTIDLQP